jgi:AAA15 family ATPase/GTPase
MPISSITIENFKGIKEPIRVDFKPITLLFGPNSAGKSTIVQALHYALEIFERNNLDPDRTSIGGNVVDLGGFETLVYNHDVSKSIRLKIELDLQDEDLPQYIDGYEDIGLSQFSDKQIEKISMRATSAAIEVSVKWSRQLSRPVLFQYKVEINGAHLATIETTDDGKQVFLSKINPLNPVFLENISPDEAQGIIKRYFAEESAGEDEFEKLGPILPALMTNFKMEKGIAGLTQPIGIAGAGTAMPQWGKALDFHGPIWADDTDRIDEGNLLMCLSALIVGPGELVRDGLKKMCYIGPMREIPPRNFTPEKSPDPSRWSSGLKGWDILYTAEKWFIEQLNRWLNQEDRLNAGYTIEVKRFREIGEDDPISILINEGVGLDEMDIIQTRMSEIPIKSRVSIRDEKTGIELMPQDVGIGISQTLPVIIGALHIKEGILAIEQPELHIHPALQVSLGDLFISRSRESQVCFLIETHSEHLMLRFLRRIRETDEGDLPPGKDPLRPDQLAVYYVEQGGTGVSVSPIRISEDGEFIDRWPKGFFSERAEELF